MKKLMMPLAGLGLLALLACSAQEVTPPAPVSSTPAPAAAPTASAPVASADKGTSPPAVANAATSGTAAAAPAAAGETVTNPKPKTGALTLAVIPKSNGGEYWATVHEGADAAAKDLGVTIHWDGTATESEFSEQAKMIENMVNTGIDGLALAPQNAKALRKPVETTVAAGIPVVVFDSGVEGDAQASFVATDNTAGGALGGKKLIELMGAGAGKKVLVLRLVQGSASTEERSNGCIEALKGAGATIAGDPYCEDSTVSGAKKTASNTLEGLVKNGKLDLDGIFACNMYTTLGMRAALDDLRKSGVQITSKFVGFDSNKNLVDDLLGGKIDALVVQNPKKMGYLAVSTLVDYLRGKPVAKKIDTGVALVTADGLKTDAAMRQLVGLK